MISLSWYHILLDENFLHAICPNDIIEICHDIIGMFHLKCNHDIIVMLYDIILTYMTAYKVIWYQRVPRFQMWTCSSESSSKQNLKWTNPSGFKLFNQWLWTMWIKSVVFKRIGITTAGARKFCMHLQASEMSKTNGQPFFFKWAQPETKPRIGPKWALKGFAENQKLRYRFWTRNDSFLYEGKMRKVIAKALLSLVVWSEWTWMIR
jgi:hypothetical protein